MTQVKAAGPRTAQAWPMEPSRDTSRPVFRAEGVTRVYRSGSVAVQALRGVDLSLHEGELVVLLGASGSGKSTLLNILGGLDRPTAGRVFFRDIELTHASDTRLTEPATGHILSVAAAEPRRRAR
jgi:putative ABC transport system ATP-binding protein